MPEPETKRPGERGDEDYGTPGLNGQEPARREQNAELAGSPSPEESAGPEDASAASRDAVEGGDEEVAEAAIEAGLSEFAEDVVSGLEHARLGGEESDSFDQGSDDSGKEPAAPSETFFAEWGSFGAGQQSAGSAEQQTESFIHPDTPAPSLNALSRMGLAGYTDAASTSTSRAGKHEELADAVQSALFSIYGETAYPPAGRDYSNAALGDGASSSMSWNKGLKADFAPSNANGDGLSPQDVILNYFDYSPGGNSSAPSAYGRASPHEDPVPNFVRSRSEQAAPQQRNWAAQDYSAYRPERAEAKSAQYDGPPSYPYPVPAAVTSRQAGRTGHESSKLLGAAAIGLMGGIAIAASLAAFLIYGPRPASVDIPIIGKLPLDRGDLPAGQEEAALEQRVGGVKPAPEISSELLAADIAVTPGQAAPLSISIRPQPSERAYVSIGGLPEGGRLTAGVDMGGGNWLVPPRRLNGLAINLPAGAPDVVPIHVQLVDFNTRTPLSAKTEFSVRVRSANPQYASTGTLVPAPRPAPLPAPAPRAPAPPDSIFRTETVSPPIQASPIATASAAVPDVPASRPRVNPRPEVEDLIREGNKRMREGDILEARQFYQKAVALGGAAGDADAALAMGRSYDPIYFARIDKKNAEPDAAKAFDWYRKARDAGAVQTAMVRIENLKHFLNE